MAGLRASGTLGMQYHSFDFGLTFVTYNCHIDYDLKDDLDYTTHYYSEKYHAYAVLLNIAYNFQFKK